VALAVKAIFTMAVLVHQVQEFYLALVAGALVTHQTAQPLLVIMAEMVVQVGVGAERLVTQVLLAQAVTALYTFTTKEK